MKKIYYALIARGVTTPFANGAGHSFIAPQLEFMQTEAETRVDALVRLYDELSGQTPQITAVKPQGQRFILGFTADEWDEVSTKPVRIREGDPDREGIQIQGISETPYR